MIRLWTPDDYLPSHQFEWWEPEDLRGNQCSKPNKGIVNWYRQALVNPDTRNRLFLEESISYDKWFMWSRLRLLVMDWMTWRISSIAQVMSREEAEHLIDVIIAYDNWTNDTIVYDEHWKAIDIE